MPAPRLPAFDPRDVPESNATSYPEPYRAVNLHRYNRRLGDHAGLRNYGVVMTRIVPGGPSSHRYAHSRQDEFIYVLEGEVTLETNAGQQILSAGMCAGFPAGVIATATGRGVDFVSRWFAPKHGEKEDIGITGSAPCSLVPYWADRLGKTTLRARQLSPRGGLIECELQGDRVRLSCIAVKYMQGHLYV